MKRLCDTFVVRRWQLGGGEERFVIQHVQSGARSIVGSLAEVYAWMRAVTVVTTEEARAPPGGAMVSQVVAGKD